MHEEENKCRARHNIKKHIMVNIERCKKVLNNGERKYKDEEIKMIRDFLYQLAKLEINELKLK